MTDKDFLLKEFSTLDSACISDALDSFGISGGLVGIKSRVKGIICVGLAYTVKYSRLDKPKKFMNAGNYIENVPANSIIVIDNDGREDCTNWGGILSNFAISRKIAGTVINGAARDIDIIEKLKYPLFTKHVFMQSAKNRAIKTSEQCVLNIQGVEITPGDIIFCDDNGCVVVPINIALEVLKRGNIIKQNEDKIINAISTGMSLEEARREYNYSKPWEK